MLKKLLCPGLLVFGLHVAYAGAVSETDAQTVAINFFKITYANQVRGSLNATLKFSKVEADSTVDFYVFDISPARGFVIVSARDEVMPVIAYSNESPFDTGFSQIGLSNWVNKTAGQIHHTVLQQIEADTRISSLWTDYKGGINPGGEKSNGVGPMLSTTWNQEPYYNMDCPVNPNDGQLCVTGCVATAMAQIMKFWNYPAQGTGSFSYDDDNANGDNLNIGVLSANFGTTTYQWTQMPDYLTGNNSAIGTLMSDCGISVAMDYTDFGSGAWVLQVEANAHFGHSGSPCAQYSYPNYFLYNPNTIQGVYQRSYTNTQWINLLEAEFNAGRVVQYQGTDPSAGGHTWVCDGYDVNNNLHMNWGWGGADNGFYAVTNLSPGGYDFYYDDAALIGIEPLNYHPDTVCNASAAFTYQNLGGSVLQFTNNSTSNQVLQSSWTFYNSSGQFATSTAYNPQITFTGTPPYSANLVVSDSLGAVCRDSITQTLTIANCTGITIRANQNNSVSSDVLSCAPARVDSFEEYFQAVDWTYNGTPGESRDFLKFDLSEIPAGSVIVSALVNLYADTTSINGVYGEPMYGTTNASYLMQITSLWNYNTVTWNTQPSVTTTGEILLPQSTSATENYLDIDISGFAQNWVNDSSQNYGMELRLVAPSTLTSMIFCSGYKVDTTLRPLLNICYIPPVKCQARGSFVQQNLGSGVVRFTNTSTDNTSFTSQWTFYNSAGQFSSSTATNPQITFTGQPPYSATLIITDSICSDTVTQIVNLNNCVTFTHSVGAELSTTSPSTNWDFTTYHDFMSSHWTNGGVPTEDRGLLKFDLSQIPPGSSIISAQLNLYADSLTLQGPSGQPTFGTNNASYLHLVDTAWDATTVTWNTQPAAISNTNEILLPQSTGLDENYLNIDISSFVQNWVNNPSTNNGMLLEMITQNHYNCLIFCSSGYPDSTKWPTLNICYKYASPCHILASFNQQNLGGGAVQFTNTSTTGGSETIHWTFYNGNGVEGTSTLNNPFFGFSGPLPYSATLQITDTSSGCMDTVQQAADVSTCISFQQGSTQATGAEVSANYPTTNMSFANGYQDFLAFQWTFNSIQGEGRGLFKYNLSQIPTGSVIVSASLNLYADSISSNGHTGQPTYGSNNACYLQQVTSPWDSVTVTWDDTPSVTTRNEVLLPQSSNYDENYLNLDIATFVQSWVDTPSQNYGMLLRMITPNYYNIMDFCSPAFPDSSKWPLLQVCYIIPSSCTAKDSFSYQILGGDTVQFINLSSSTNGYSSYWIFSNGNGHFATSTEADPLVVFTGTAPYYAYLSTTDSLTARCNDSTATLIKGVTGLAAPGAKDGGLVIFPNPNNGTAFNLRLPSGYDVSITRIKVYDVLGSEASFAIVERSPVFIKLSLNDNAAAGMYTVVANCSNKQSIGKLVVVK